MLHQTEHGHLSFVLTVIMRLFEDWRLSATIVCSGIPDAGLKNTPKEMSPSDTKAYLIRIWAEFEPAGMSAGHLGMQESGFYRRRNANWEQPRQFHELDGNLCAKRTRILVWSTSFCSRIQQLSVALYPSIILQLRRQYCTTCISTGLVAVRGYICILWGGKKPRVEWKWEFWLTLASVCVAPPPGNDTEQHDQK